MSLGFTRGTAPSKWADRWQRVTRTPLELMPFDRPFGRDPELVVDVTIERSMPETKPLEAMEPRSRHAVRLYEEAVALVVPAEHELAGRDRVSRDDVALAGLLDHADHPADWPDAEPWVDPAWKPADPVSALALVAAGTGSILLPFPLARHLASRRQHAVVLVAEAEELSGTTIWATWDIDRDADDVQHLIGILRGRTARSSR